MSFSSNHRKITQAVILCGGLGSRMGEIFPSLPKALLPLGESHLIDLQLKALVKAHVSQFLLLAGHLGEAVERHLESKSYIQPITIQRERTPLGTAGALWHARRKLAEHFYLLSGDIAFGSLAWSAFAHRHFEKRAVVTVGVRLTDHPEDSDIAKVDGRSQVIQIGRGVPSTGAPPLGLTSLYTVSRTAVETMRPGAGNWERDVVAPLVEVGAGVFAFMMKGYIKDVGTPDRWRRANLDLKHGVLN